MLFRLAEILCAIIGLEDLFVRWLFRDSLVGVNLFVERAATCHGKKSREWRRRVRERVSEELLFREMKFRVAGNRRKEKEDRKVAFIGSHGSGHERWKAGSPNSNVGAPTHE